MYPGLSMYYHSTYILSIPSFYNVHLPVHKYTYSCHLNPELKVNMVYLYGFQDKVMAAWFSNYMANSLTNQPSIWHNLLWTDSNYPYKQEIATTLSFNIILTTTPMIPKLSCSLPRSFPTKYMQQEEKNNYFTTESSFQG